MSSICYFNAHRAAPLRRDWTLAMLGGAVVFIPSVVIYAVLGRVSGCSELHAQIGAYGLATTCPWRTGFGIFGTAAVLEGGTRPEWLRACCWRMRVHGAAAWPEMLSNRLYGVLQTSAGSVQLLNYKIDSAAYEYVMAHTSPEDCLVELPYGGGLNFATCRRCPI